MDDITIKFIEMAKVELLPSLLLPDADVIRIYQHWPTPEMCWWDAKVPLRRDGTNRDVTIHGLAYDLELSKKDFIDWIDDFTQGGITLVQSALPLPYDLHPLRFRSDESFLQTLRDNGAQLMFELPHPNETARLTVFGEAAKNWVTQQDISFRQE